MLERGRMITTCGFPSVNDVEYSRILPAESARTAKAAGVCLLDGGTLVLSDGRRFQFGHSASNCAP